MAFFGYPKGHRVKSETSVFQQHGGLTFPVDTLPRTKRLKNPTAPPGKIPGMERTLCQRRSNACCFRCLASKLPPFFQIMSVIAAIFRARVRRAIAGLIPLVSKVW
jgi:hypothetical protein